MLAVAQAAEEPFPFALPVPPAVAPPSKAPARRRKLPKARTTSAIPRATPAQPTRSGSDSLDRVLQTALEAYVSLNGDADLGELLAQNDDDAGPVDALTLLDHSAFEPVAEGAQQFFPTAGDAYSTLPFYQLPLPVPPTAYRVPGSAAMTQSSGFAPIGLSSSAPLKSQREIASFLTAGAAAFRQKDAPPQDCPQTDQNGRAGLEERAETGALPASGELEEPDSAAGAASGSTAIAASSPMRRDRGDPMLLAPIRTNSISTISTIPPIRRSSWLMSPVASTFAPSRPVLSVDAAGAFARLAHEGNFSFPGSGAASAGGGISALFRRSSMNLHNGSASTMTPLRSAVDEAGLRPMGSSIRLWRQADYNDSRAGSPARVASPDDMLDERFEPRAEAGGAFAGPANAFEGLQGDWAPFLPRLANEVERTDLTLVEEPEEIEADLAVDEAKMDGPEVAGEAGLAQRTSESSLRGTEGGSGADLAPCTDGPP